MLRANSPPPEGEGSGVGPAWEEAKPKIDYLLSPFLLKNRSRPLSNIRYLRAFLRADGRFFGACGPIFGTALTVQSFDFLGK